MALVGITASSISGDDEPDIVDIGLDADINVKRIRPRSLREEEINAQQVRHNSYDVGYNTIVACIVTSESDQNPRQSYLEEAVVSKNCKSVSVCLHKEASCGKL
ncbi:hypothetical protein J6590_045260 [Homalodisca vitripennis]|nr:hypothetical protein J6590_045260 [Homalodisca vitripennis]